MERVKALAILGGSATPPKSWLNFQLLIKPIHKT